MSWGKNPQMIVHESDPYNAEPPVELLAAAARTPVDLFYSRNHGPVPESSSEWSLSVEGDVGTRLTLGLAELQAMQHVSVDAVLQCAGNRRAELIAVRDIPGEHPWGRAATSDASWTGCRLADVLRLAGVEDVGADAHVAFEAPDVSTVCQPPQTYGSSIPFSKACSPEVLLAWAMNDRPLERVHGAPVRVVVPGFIGARSVKWISRITVQPEPSDNYFQATAYRIIPPEADPDTAGPDDGISLGPIAVNAAILTPRPHASEPCGPLEIAGYAVAGGERQVARVDVSADGTTWVQAELSRASRWSWVRWWTTLELTAGTRTLQVRAWDDAGGLAPESAAARWNPKGYANTSWDSVTIDVV